MIPAFIFLFGHRKMHHLLTRKWRTALTFLLTAGSIAFCIWYTYFTEPIVDFRPFREGVNIREQKKAEDEAKAAVHVTAWKLQNLQTKEIKVVPDADYMANLASYPSETWEVIEQIKPEPAIPETKISHFAAEDMDGEDHSEELLSDPNYSFLVLAYHIEFKNGKSSSKMVADTTFRTDTIRVKKDSIRLVQVIDSIGKSEVKTYDYDFEPAYEALYKKVNPFMDAAQKAGFKVHGLTGPIDAAVLDDFRHSTQAAYDFYTADDVMIKTIMRSNPGVLLLKNGVIVAKFHIRDLPNFDAVKAQYMK